MKRTGWSTTIILLLSLIAAPAWSAGLRDVINALEDPFRTRRIKDFTADFFQESRIAALDRLQRARGEVKVRFDPRDADQVPLVMFHWEYQEPTRQELVSDGKTLWVYLPENNQVIQSDVEQVSKSRVDDPMTFLTGLGNLSRDFLITYAEPDRDVDSNYVLNLRPRRTTALISRMVIVVNRHAVDSAPAPAADQPPEPDRSLRTRDALRPPAEAGSTAPTRSGGFFDDDFDPQRARKEATLAEPRSGAAFEESPALRSRLDTRRSSGGPGFPILSTTVYDQNGNSTLIEFSDVRVNRGLSAGQFRFMLPPGVEVVRPTGKEMGF